MIDNVSKVILPSHFDNAINRGSFVYQLISNAENVFSYGMDYFPEYTVHDGRHISSVLELANNLIPPQTLCKLSVEALEILVSAIVFHDLGMFIKRAGLQRLIWGEHSERIIEYLDDCTWNDKWRSFYRKACRYDDRQLIRVFGDTNPVEHFPEGIVPEEDSKRQRLLYGEFLRLNHHRLAYDISLFGFPGDDCNIDMFAHCNCDSYLRDMIGLVAFSHGVDIRSVTDFLKNHRLAAASPNEPISGVPIYYLMTVMRLSDYFHAGSKRAAQERLAMNRLASHVSRNEFAWNQAVYERMIFSKEKKEVVITADPENSAVYLDLERWIYSVQRELDISWAVLAENYGYAYELSIHRITTNIFNEKSKAQFNKRFLTKIAALRVNPEIVKLLIGPFYSNDPSYGVRELLQNAVDACNERTLLDGTSGVITIDVNTCNNTFTITDNGVGMNEDVLLNYYFVSGASFRYSDIWKENFIDDSGKGKIARSGRFGIGALAAFLFGDTVTISTRHIDDDLGYMFTYEVGSSQLNITRVNNVEFGTTIIINMRETVSERLESDARSSRTPWLNWFRYRQPRVIYSLEGNRSFGKELLPDSYIPLPGENEDNWLYCSSPTYGGLHWRPPNENSREKRGKSSGYINIYGFNRNFNGKFYCNGIPLSGSLYAQGGFDIPTFFNRGLMHVDFDEVAVYDEEGKLELDLLRSKVINFHVDSSFVLDVYKYYLASLLNMGSRIADNGKYKLNDTLHGYAIAVTKQGYTLASRTLLKHANSRVVFAFVDDDWKEIYVDGTQQPDDSKPLIFVPLSMLGSSFKFEDELVWSETSGLSEHCTNAWYYSADNTNLCSSSFFRCLDKNKSAEVVSPSIYQLRLTDDVLGLPNVHFSPSEKVPVFIEYTPSMPVPDGRNLMLELLQTYLPKDVFGGWIPYDKNGRKRIYSKAFDELGKYMLDYDTLSAFIYSSKNYHY